MALEEYWIPIKIFARGKPLQDAKETLEADLHADGYNVRIEDD